MPWARRTCERCKRDFAPPHRATALSTGDNHLRLCAACRRVEKAAVANEPPVFETFQPLTTPSPMTQIVFDLETWGLDRGWGVTLVGSFLIFKGNKTEHITICSRDFAPWKQGRRSDDSAFAKRAFEILKQGHTAYAHNGEYFDIRWLRTVALKYRLDMPKLRLVDPARIAREKYRLGRNSLEAIADYLELPYRKYHLSPEIWRKALLDDQDEAWEELRTRCESDVLLLNAVAGAVIGDAGMIDYSGSIRG